MYRLIAAFTDDVGCAESGQGNPIGMTIQRTICAVQHRGFRGNHPTQACAPRRHRRRPRSCRDLHAGCYGGELRPVHRDHIRKCEQRSIKCIASTDRQGKECAISLWDAHCFALAAVEVSAAPYQPSVQT